ncbi:hypothetical protein [Thermococcus sp.]
MKAWDALGEAIGIISRNRWLLTFPVIAYALENLGEVITGYGDTAKLIGYKPGFSPIYGLPLLIIGAYLQLSAAYYTVRGYYLLKTERLGEKSGLLSKSLRYGIIIFFVALIYGLVLAFMGLIGAVPAAIAYFVLQKTSETAAIGAALLLGLPVAGFLAGVVMMMLPAYIWDDSFESGFSVIGLAWSNKKETAVFGFAMFLILIAGGAVLGGAAEFIGWINSGLAGAIVGGAVFGAGLGALSALSYIAGVLMYINLGKRPAEGSPISPDPDWLAGI